MKVVTTQTLVRIAKNARRAYHARRLSFSLERLLEPKGEHILVDGKEYHGPAGPCIRCETVALQLYGKKALHEISLDFDVDDFKALPDYQE